MLARRFTVNEYHRMISAGFFAQDDKFELLEGYIVRKLQREAIEDAVVEMCIDQLLQALPVGWRTRVRSGITTADSEPEPDIAVIRGQPLDYAKRHPGPADAALIIEVANSTLKDDRFFKGRVYARANVREYWIVNLIDKQIEVCTQPSGDVQDPAFADRKDFKIGQQVPLNIPGHSPILLNVADMLA